VLACLYIQFLTSVADLVEAYKWYPARVPVNERFGDFSAGLVNTLNIAKAWYETCHDSDWGHVSCRPSGAEIQTLPSRVIEVGTVLNPRLRLFPTGGFFREQYVTLSYCWGKALQNIVLLKDPSLQMVWEHIGLPFRELSRTIQDAILVTRQLDLANYQDAFDPKESSGARHSELVLGVTARCIN
jgi:hypothetical protein